MGYFGSKATSGLCQMLPGLFPPHDVYIESHLGGGALMQRRPRLRRGSGSQNRVPCVFRGLMALSGGPCLSLNGFVLFSCDSVVEFGRS